MGVTDCATFPTKAQAQAWATKREAEILAGARGLPSKHTVADAIDKFLKEVTPHRGSEKWERVRLNKLKRHKIALRTLSSLDVSALEGWRDSRLNAVSAATVRREIALLGAVLSQAVRWGLIRANPLKDVKKPASPAARRRGITNDEIAAITKSLGHDGAGHVIAQAFLLSLETGMRCGEILGLTWDHVNLAERYVTLPKTKNGDSRQVPLSRLAAEILRDHVPRSLPADGHLPAVDGAKDLRVFTVTPATLDVLFRRARDAAVRDCPSCATVRFHDARAEAITRLSRKLDVLELARVVGHRNLSSLMFYYNATAAEIAKKLD